jgi:hypothetical protein
MIVLCLTLLNLFYFVSSHNGMAQCKCVLCKLNNIMPSESFKTTEIPEYIRRHEYDRLTFGLYTYTYGVVIR